MLQLDEALLGRSLQVLELEHRVLLDELTFTVYHRQVKVAVSVVHRRPTLEVFDAFFDVFHGVHSLDVHQAKEEVGTVYFLFGCLSEVPVGGPHHAFFSFLILFWASLNLNGLIDFLPNRVNGLTDPFLGHVPHLAVDLLQSGLVVRM